ncbi:MAG: proline--tRNA ligase [Actinomycetota bacterium]|nr:proline--tRNA ligase [Actinomycetota bacterium]
MRYSNFFIPTLKESPGEAEIPSHSLCIRAGLVRKIAAGIYSFLPLGVRVLKKIEEIIRQEMNRTGANEVFLSVIQPSILWEKSGRWSEYGPELFRLKDRNKRDFCLGPTHEELTTYLAYLDIKSYKDLPINLYQIQTKFRDEIRPRYGLLRAREFIMKDAYSFSKDYDDLEVIYNKMHDAYCRILERIGLEYRVVIADTGLIGGKLSHEFIVLADNGEEKMVFCPKCGYAANYELSESVPQDIEEHENSGISDRKLYEENAAKEVYTPGITDIESLSKFLNVDAGKIIKTILLKDETGKIYAFLLSGDRELNIKKAATHTGKSLNLLENSEERSDLVIGYLGPVGLDNEIEIYIDNSIKSGVNYIAGANKKDYHLLNVNYPRDFTVKHRGDFTYSIPGDRCTGCGEKLEFEKGIEIGHIFKLGTRYSEKLEAKFLDVDGKLKPLIMGCYGVGVTRLMAATIEQLHDDRGIIWPVSIAPFIINLIVTTTKDEKLSQEGNRIYKTLKELDVEVLYDDRDISAGIKFKDSDLIGIPVKFILGKKFLNKKIIDVEFRKSGDKIELREDLIPEFIKKFKSENNLN